MKTSEISHEDRFKILWDVLDAKRRGAEHPHAEVGEKIGLSTVQVISQVQRLRRESPMRGRPLITQEARAYMKNPSAHIDRVTAYIVVNL